MRPPASSTPPRASARTQLHQQSNNAIQTKPVQYVRAQGINKQCNTNKPRAICPRTAAPNKQCNTDKPGDQTLEHVLSPF